MDSVNTFTVCGTQTLSLRVHGDTCNVKQNKTVKGLQAP